MFVDTWILNLLLFSAAIYGIMEKQWSVLLYGMALFFLLLIVQKWLQTFGEADIYAWVTVFVLAADWRFLIWLMLSMLCTILFFWHKIFRKQPAPFFPGMAMAYIFILGGLAVW